MNGASGWTRPFHRKQPLVTNNTLFAQIADAIEQALPNNRQHVNSNACTIRIASISLPHVVHEITVKRVS